jgi:hypothetical protein
VTLPAPAERVGCRPGGLALILREEVQRGRVTRTRGGGYALVAAAFTPETLTALRELA